MFWKFCGSALDLATRACVMGIVNVTPDSFSDGGRFAEADRAIDHALQLLEEGAAIIDVGGESTRPGAEPVKADEEMRRVLPVIKGIRARAPDCAISIDTTKAVVAQAAIELGASIINDVTALTGDRKMLPLAVRTRTGIVLMHMQGTPQTMQVAPHYDNPVVEVRRFLCERCQAAVNAGVYPDNIALDGGIGFGKTFEHNLALLRNHEHLSVAGRPFVVGISRKAFLGRIAGEEAMEKRLAPALAMTALLRQKGARIFRTHDVASTVAALHAAEALLEP